MSEEPLTTSPAQQRAPEVLCDVDEGVAVVTLNRPERRNAWTFDLELLYFEILDRCDDDESVRVVVLTGAGDSFCVGMDMAVLSCSSQQATPPSESLRPRPITHTRTLRKPVIAALNGACAGIGFVQALAADIRFAAAGAKIAPAFTRRGLPAEFGSSWMLTRLVGHGVASDLLLSSRTITSEEALEMGIVNRVLPRDELMPHTMTYARDLAANCSPLAMAAVKTQLASDWHRDFDAAYWNAKDIVADANARIDYREGVASFVERRPPRFRPLPRRP